MNPFRYSSPVGGGDLIDRDDEAAALLEGAAQGNNSRLVAPRRYGKTSLLRRVLADADRGGWIGVYVDFFGVVSLGDVSDRIERAYTQSLQGRLARWWEGLRRSLRPSLRVGVPGATVGADLSDPAAASLLDRLALPVAVSERADARVLVVFDEFQAVLTAHDNVDAIIRSEIQHHADAASYIFAGSQVGMMQQLFADRRRAFYAQARPLTLPPLPPGADRRLPGPALRCHRPPDRTCPRPGARRRGRPSAAHHARGPPSLGTHAAGRPGRRSGLRGRPGRRHGGARLRSSSSPGPV